jgi:hypothetical protein
LKGLKNGPAHGIGGFKLDTSLFSLWRQKKKKKKKKKNYLLSNIMENNLKRAYI